MQQHIEKFGRLDILVNNARYSLVGSIEEISDEEFRKTVDFNFFRAVNVIRNAIPFKNEQLQHLGLPTVEYI